MTEYFPNSDTGDDIARAVSGSEVQTPAPGVRILPADPAPASAPDPYAPPSPSLTGDLWFLVLVLYAMILVGSSWVLRQCRAGAARTVPVVTRNWWQLVGRSACLIRTGARKLYASIRWTLLWLSGLLLATLVTVLDLLLALKRHYLVQASDRAKCPACGYRGSKYKQGDKTVYHQLRWHPVYRSVLHACARCGAPWGEQPMMEVAKWEVHPVLSAPVQASTSAQSQSQVSATDIPAIDESGRPPASITPPARDRYSDSGKVVAIAQANAAVPR